MIYPCHGRLIQFAHAVFQPPLIQGADLLQQDDAVLGESAGRCLYVNVGGQLCLFPAAGDAQITVGLCLLPTSF